MNAPLVKPLRLRPERVRAVLDGRMTMLREEITPLNCEFGSIPVGKLTKLYWKHADWGRSWKDQGFPNPEAGGAYTHGYMHVLCHESDAEDSIGCDTCLERGWGGTAHRLYPRLVPGMLLWVREAWTARMTHGWTIADARSGMYQQEIIYRADGDEALDGWWPSIHMPREFSRLTLKVASVKIERLQDISEEDAVAEGMTEETAHLILTPEEDALFAAMCFLDSEGGRARKLMALVWDKLHGPGSWDANPWVAATTFEVIKRNVDDVIREMKG